MATNVSALRVGIAGTGGIGLASAAWLAAQGHDVALWSPSGQGAEALRHAPLVASGVLEASVPVRVADTPAALSDGAGVLIVAVTANGHRRVMDALLPQLRSGQTVIVNSMASLSALYLHEAARRAGLDITVASWGTTALTARREGAAAVRIMARRVALGVSALPLARSEAALALCRALFGDRFSPHANALATVLSNINPVAHGPLAIFNWTRIERAEAWPQYHCMTPQVAAVIEKLDAERRALARAFGLEVRSIERHFAESFGTSATRLADIAAELHAQRNGPPGPTDTKTRYLAEDMPYGLVFQLELARMAGVSAAATAAIVAAASLLAGRDYAADNDLIEPLGLRTASVAGLLARVDEG